MSKEQCCASCECAECQEWDADEELGATDLEERLEAVFNRAEGRKREG